MRCEERRKTFIQAGIEQALRPPLRDARELTQCNREIVESQRQWSTVEVSSRDDCVFEDKWIVRSAVQLNLKDPSCVCERVPYGAMDLRNTAQAVGVLNAATLPMVPGNRASLQKASEVICAQNLSRVRSRRMQARIKGCGCSAQRFQTQSSGCLSGIKEVFYFLQSEAADRQHRLGSVQQRYPLFAFEGKCLQPCMFEANFGRQYAPLILSLTLANQYQGHMGERSKITTCAYAAARRNYGRDLLVQQIADTFGDNRTYS